MLIPLIVTISLFVHVCTAGPYDMSFAKLTASDGALDTWLYASAIFSNGDVLVGGFSNGLVGFPTAGNQDFILQRYSETGYLLWTKVFGGTGSDGIYAVAVDSSDNIYATGYTSSDVYIAKFDSSGNTIFSTQVGGTAFESGFSICLDSDRGVFYIVGYTQSSTFYDVTSLSGGTMDAFLLKIDSGTGAVISNTQQGVAGGYNSYFDVVSLDSTGAVWVVGATFAPTFYGQTNHGGKDVTIQKFSSSGTLLFTHFMGSTANDDARASACDTSDNLYVTGIVSAAVDGQSIIGGTDIFLTKFNSAGTKLWTKLLGSAGQDTPNAIAVDSAKGLVYITGNIQTASFYGAAPPSSTFNTAYFLAVNSADGSYVSSSIFPATGQNSVGEAIATRAGLVYMAGRSAGNFQGQTKPGPIGKHAGFVMKLGNGTIANSVATPAPTIAVTAAPTTSAPTLLPSASPSVVPTASPTAVCMHWALGDYGESCSTTCSKLSRTCKDKYLKEIVTHEAFYAVVGSAVNSRTGGAVGTAETFCSLTPESVVTVGAPAALSVVLSSEDHHSPVRTSCSYPASVAEATAGCDDVLPLHNYRRFCPCLDHNCDGAWYLGYSGDSCDATCTSAGGVCDAEPLSNIVSSGEFSAMVASTTVVGTNELIGESSAEFCHEGINILPLAPAPSVITLTFGAVNETLCAYPTSVSNLQGSCDMAFTDLPAQRFCNCKVTGSASHPHRMLLAPAAVTAPEPAVAVQATPRLRGKA